MGELKRVTKEEYLKIKKKIFPNDEARLRIQKILNMLIRKHFTL